ncbi:hypothetical protein [Streptomyces antimycoticus]|uniref:hypothetical protein n=1 Tax=Streptomyces antimycoticus TaxID=68175 RepID=UPI0036AC6322
MLRGISGRAGSCVRVGSVAGVVAADDLDAGLVGQPAGQGRCLVVGQQVDGSAGLDVDQRAAVDVALAQGEIVDAEDARGLRRGSGRAWISRSGGVGRLTAALRTAARRAPARPAGVSAITCTTACNR